MADKQIVDMGMQKEEEMTSVLLRNLLVSKSMSVIKKVDTILESLKVPISNYETELNDLKFTFSSISNSLKQTRLANANLPDQMSRMSFKSEEQRMWIEKIESELSRSRDESIYLQRDNLKFLKQRNIFCLIAKRLYSNITQLHLDCAICKKIHKVILPFLEFKEDEIDVDCYKCESIVSSDETSEAYIIGLDKIESFKKSKDQKDKLKNLLDEF